MIYGQFLIAFCLYICMAISSYHSAFKMSPWYFPVAVGAAILCNLLWFTIAKADLDPSSLVIKGLIWDAMLMLCYLLVPLLFFNAKFTTTQAVGVGLTLLGLFLTKL